MSSSFEVTDHQHCSKFSIDKQVNKSHPQNILKAKENISKCNKTLKKKLKKYKLRKDGKEDEDIIDVSKTLISSLKIKSPNGQEAKFPVNNIEVEERLPKNYLSKMVRKKNVFMKTATEDTPNILDSKHTQSTLPEAENNESRHTNAFKLLMDSRNKSIGGNSPGKDKQIEVIDETEQMRRKELKAKRNLVLHQMAQKKGLAKNQENEEFIDKCINLKLEKRADRLKEMITLNITKKESKSKPINSENKIKSNLNNGINIEEETVVKSSKLQLFNFLTDDENSVSEKFTCNSKISNEDEEFLKKLGPSIRKKENMLSYFQKLEKTNALDCDPETETNDNNNSENSIIKVKFLGKHKKKKTKLKIAIDPKVTFDKAVSNATHITEIELDDKLNSSFNNTPTRKRKRDKTSSHSISSQIEDNSQVEKVPDENINIRPKRNTKKPVKYSEDALLSSSDEEQIFSPIKRKNVNKKLDCLQNEVAIVPENTSKPKLKVSKPDVKSSKSSNKKDVKVDSKPVKLAPIFSTKSKLTPSEQAAKESFLKSGVPDKLKIKHKENTNIVIWNHYYATVHVEQNENKKYTEIDTTNIKYVEWFAAVDTDIKSILYDDHNFYLQLINLQDKETSNIKFILKHKTKDLLSYMKNSYSRFPVYRTFHLLKTKSKAEIKDINVCELDNSIEIVKEIGDYDNDYPDKLSWNEKYKPMSTKQIIGNFESVKELKRWLESWNESQNFKGKNDESDLSDFCFSDSETNSRDPFKHTNNVLIISGKSGTGKTSCVYAVAAELAIKVIEVNASSRRTGKIMLQDLQEATQSHKVNRGHNKKGSSQNSQSSQENDLSSKIFKKRGRPKKTYERKSKCIESKDIVEINSLSQQSQLSSQEKCRTESSLILIDDADIVFDQDDGFCSAISQLINYSKRPVILITSSLSCPHLQKYISCGKIIKMNTLMPSMLGMWLDIMCLADTNTCCPGFGRRILDYYKGDIRKTINFLQFYMTTNKHLNEIDDGSQETDFNANIDDENSSMSWIDQNSEDITKEVDDKEIKRMVDAQIQSLHLHNFDLFNVWWNLPNEFNSENQTRNLDKDTTSISLDKASCILDNISFIDYMDTTNSGCMANITSKPWMTYESPSVMEKENMDPYDDMNGLNREISREIIEKSISLLGNRENAAKPSPSMSTQRKRNKIVSQHNTLTKYLSPSSTLDRRALALDYWPSCRTICRLEKNKTDSNLKRNNRFCHYLKSLNIQCKNDNFDDLCEGLS